MQLKEDLENRLQFLSEKAKKFVEEHLNEEKTNQKETTQKTEN